MKPLQDSPLVAQAKDLQILLRIATATKGDQIDEESEKLSKQKVKHVN